MTTALVRLDNVTRRYPLKFRRKGDGPRAVTAADEVSLEVHPGRTLTLIGESGSGKTTLLKMVLGIETPDSGRVYFEGRPLESQTAEQRLEMRRSVQAVFQDPWASLSPRMRAEDIVAEPLQFAGRVRRTQALERARDSLEQVGLSAEFWRRLPHQLSGGQRQRVAIARAITLRPKLIVLDEPVSALDVTIRAQILELLKALQEKYRLAYLLVAHDFSTIWTLSDDVVVLNKGRAVEQGPADIIRTAPEHTYTRQLLAAALPAHPRDRRQWQDATCPVPADAPAFGFKHNAHEGN